MYEDNKKFNLIGFIIKLIVFVIAILFILWVVSLNTKGLSNSIEALNDNTVSEKINEMKEAGTSYFTTERLPKTVGESEKITLNEMYEKHLLLEIKDKNGNKCSGEHSYVSVKKLETEYEMKIYLECGDSSDYIIVKMGCYNYCTTDLCETKETTDVKSTETEKQYQYVYKTSGKWSSYGSWSNWSTTKVTSSSSKQVETKNQTETYKEAVTTYKNIDVAYLQRTTSSTATADPICPSKDGYTFTGRNGFTCNYSKTTTSYTTSRQYVATKTGEYLPGDTSTYHYEYVDYDLTYDCVDTCRYKNVYTYKVYKKVTKSNTNTVTATSDATCPTGYKQNNGTCTKVTTSYTNECPIGTTEKANKTGCTKTVTETNYVDKTRTITLYRYRTRKYTAGTTTYKWSTSKNDTTLLNAGYKLTGKTRTTESSTK